MFFQTGRKGELYRACFTASVKILIGQPRLSLEVATRHRVCEHTYTLKRNALYARHAPSCCFPLSTQPHPIATSMNLPCNVTPCRSLNFGLYMNTTDLTRPSFRPQ
jgi:hypothetical protein